MKNEPISWKYFFGFLALMLTSMYLPLYIGCELMPDDWMVPDKFWWSAPAALIFIVWVVVGTLVGFVGACIEVGLIPEDSFP